MNKQTSSVLTVLVLIVMVIGLYLYSQRSPLPMESDNTISTQNVDQNSGQTEQEDSIARSPNTGVYQNTRLKFQLQMPRDWEIVEDANEDKVGFMPHGKADDAPTGGSVSVEENQNNVTIETLLQEAKQVPYYNNFKNITIADESAFSFVTSEFSGTIAKIIHGGKIYTLTNEIVTNSTILASFKFIQ